MNASEMGLNRLELCPACGEGLLEPQQEEEEVEHAGHKGTITLRYAVCDRCGSEITGSTDMLANKRAMIGFRKLVDGLLPGKEVRAFRQRFQMSQALAAQLFGGGKVGFSRYENDDIAQSDAMDGLIHLCMDNPVNLLLLARYRRTPLPDAITARIHDQMLLMLRLLAPKISKQLDAQRGGMILRGLTGRGHIIPFRLPGSAQRVITTQEVWPRKAA